ncbi:MAG: stage II sporulation protein M [Thaumarchaeota archaeon]|nr:stage II sporulation protein M [Nitrososphaerota archaeon]
MNLKTRLTIVGIVFLVLSFIFAYSSTIQVNQSDAASLSESFKNIDTSVVGIFVNNVQIALLEFIPGFGPGFSAYSSYSTGLVLSAVAQTNSSIGVTGLELYFGLLLTPIYWLEFACYSLAVEESIAVVVSFRTRDFRTREWKWLLGSLLFVVATLFVSARLEVGLINLVK